MFHIFMLIVYSITVLKDRISILYGQVIMQCNVMSNNDQFECIF